MALRLADMDTGDLRLPPMIARLVDSGRWPTTAEQALSQNSTPLVAPERVAALVADEGWLYLYPPPFSSVAANVALHAAKGWSFWTEHGALGELEPDLALIIGDFGPGSDAPILLDYRRRPDPSVMKLSWSAEGSGPPFDLTTTWITVAESFDEFADRLGLA